jgi:hypothetical protein
MEIIKQIKQICLETDNEWFLSHEFTKIAIYDLELKEQLEKEIIFNFDERKCLCSQGLDCIYCNIEIIRSLELNKLNLSNCHYDYEKSLYDAVYIKSKWIIPEKIDGEIPGFLLIKCCGIEMVFTHELVFAIVRPKYRKRGILKNMVYNIPKEWNIWLEANSNVIDNVENIWEKCGFSYHKTIDKHLIYKKGTF